MEQLTVERKGGHYRHHHLGYYPGYYFGEKQRFGQPVGPHHPRGRRAQLPTPNTRFLPEASFPQALTVSSDIEEAVTPADLVVIAVPSHRLRENIQRIRDGIALGATILSATKGLELPTGKRMSQVIQEELPPHLHSSICALSGPTSLTKSFRGNFPLPLSLAKTFPKPSEPSLS